MYLDVIIKLEINFKSFVFVFIKTLTLFLLLPFLEIFQASLFNSMI